MGTYNVLGITGFPKDAAAADLGAPASVERLTHFVDVFTQLETDVLHIEEGVTLKMAQQLADGLGYYVATFASPMDWSANGLGHGCTGHVFSRFPILESRTFSHHPPVSLADAQQPARGGVGGALAEGGVPFSRTAGAALLDLGDGVTLWAVTLHLHPGDVQMRIVEAELVAAKIPELLAVTPHVLVGGDFNCTIEESVHDVLKGLGFMNALDSIGGGCQQPTMATLGIMPTLQAIDHIYCSASLAPTLRGARVVRDHGFRQEHDSPDGCWSHSDHLPVIADFQVPWNSKAPCRL
eukprot:SAG31_NODE_3594_length_4089_cov_1.609774_3_plen_295_part_00